MRTPLRKSLVCAADVDARKFTSNRGWRARSLASHWLFDYVPRQKDRMATVSRYLRETSLIKAEAVLSLPDGSRVRAISEREATQMAAEIRKRNLFSRHSWENDFYYNRALSFGGKTVIEVFRTGQPNDIAAEVASVAEWGETVALLSVTLATERKTFLRRVGGGPVERTEIDLILGPDLRHLRSKSRVAPKRTGFPLTRQAVTRFERLGFSKLYTLLTTQSPFSARLRRAAGWLSESRREPNLEAAVVKSVISLESLLILGESEPLSRSLSERSAFLLSPLPETRRRVGTLVGRLYEVRSGIVHGGRRKRKNLTPRLLEACDRLAVLLLMVTAHNSDSWVDEDGFRRWVGDERWGPPSRLVLPFPPVYLSRALGLGERS